jgi:hypothetical protein
MPIPQWNEFFVGPCGIGKMPVPQGNGFVVESRGLAREPALKDSILGNKIKRGGIHAITLTGGLGSVVKYVTQMSVADSA